MIIHATSIVSSDVELGDGVEVGPYCNIQGQVKIGAGSYIEGHVTIGSRHGIVEIGKNNHISPGAVIGGPPQDISYKAEPTKLIIGDNNVIREFTTLNIATTKGSGATVIGNNCYLMAYAHVGHDCKIGNNVIMANYVGLAGHVTVEDFVIMEVYAAIQQFVTVGAHSFLAATSHVRKNVPPFIRVAREPLQYIGVNTVGLARRGFDKETINAIEDIYRLIFVRGHNVTKALELVEQEITHCDVKTQIVDFIKASKDGIIKGI